MSSDVEELSLTPKEREIARAHWDAMMFAPSRSELEKARIALMEAPFAIQQAVIADINANWLREYEPDREENPFLPPVSFQDLNLASKDENSDGRPLDQSEPFHFEPIADYVEPPQSLTSYTQRFIEGLSHFATPGLSGQIDSHTATLRGASPHH